MISVRSNCPVCCLVDAEIGRQLHRAAHPFGDVDERTVREDRRVQGRIEVVGDRNDRSEIFTNDLRIVADRLRDRRKDHAGLLEFLLEGGHHRHGIEHGIDGDARSFHASQNSAFMQGDAKLFVCGQKFRIDLVEALRPRRRLRRRIVVDVLEIDLGIVDPCPCGLDHGQPSPIRLKPPFEHPFGLVFLGGNEADRVFGEADLRLLRFDIRDESVFVLVYVDVTNGIDRLFDGWHSCVTPSTAASRTAGRADQAADTALFVPNVIWLSTRRHLLSNKSKSFFVDSHPKDSRIALLAIVGGTFIASRT